MKTRISLTLFLIIQMFISNGQIVKYEFDNDLEGWTTNIIANLGVWEYKDNGKANEGAYWNDRDSIHSSSGGGAIVCNGDNFITSIPPIGVPTDTYITAIESPPIDVGGSSRIFIKFNQYFRNLNSETRVEVSTDGGMDWISFPINLDVKQNVETSPADVKYMDITPSNLGDFIKVRFVYEGDYYFWIIDDVEIYNEDPSPQTFPTRYSDSLEVFGKPYEIDSSNWAYVPNEIVVQFKTNTTPAERQLIRDSLGATLKKSCVCDRLELWEFGNPSGDTTASPDGNTIGINENVKASKSKSKIDGVDVNKYNFNQLQNLIPLPSTSFDSIPNGISATTDQPTLVAILDTGIDFENQTLQPYIYLNDDELDSQEIDDDENCQKNDPLGWNFVDNNNNPTDDHSHGTHVAGIIRNNFLAEYGDTCNMKMIAYKTHDSYGVSNLFDVTCATYQALEDNVNVINDSWGFYGDSSIILSNAIDTIRLSNILVVSAAGNDGLKLSNHVQFPACYHAPNVLTVGSLFLTDSPTGIIFNKSLFSNFDSICVDILAPGENIESTVPIFIDLSGLAEKTGTSMSAPVVTAAAAIAFCSGLDNYLSVKNNILDCADKYSYLQDTIKQGNILNFNINCLTPINNIEIEQKIDFKVFPNPVTENIFIIPNQSFENLHIEIISLTGEIVKRKKIWSNSQLEIRMEELPSGIYFLKIRDSNYIWSQKIIKI